MCVVPSLESKADFKSEMPLILTRCYIGFLGVSVVVVTLATWPLILLFQQYRVTREWYYSNIFGLICKLFTGVLVAPKRKLFDSMNKHFKELPTAGGQDDGDVFSVLEIGPGTGDNFKYYKSAIKLTTIDLNPFLEQTAQKLSAEYPLVNIVDSRVANAENMTCFEDNSFDIVCGTLIMCCINDNAAALNEIHRVLKPNGRFYYLEGNRMQPSRSVLIRFVEEIFGKFWITCEYGCKFMQNNFDEKLKSSKMSSEWHEIHRIRECAIGHEVHYGCAVKV